MSKSIIFCSVVRLHAMVCRLPIVARNAVMFLSTVIYWVFVTFYGVTFYLIIIFGFIMNRAWNILCWNVIGINATEKWPNIKNKFAKHNCEIFCFQETKRESFDPLFVRNFAL